MRAVSLAGVEESQQGALSTAVKQWNITKFAKMIQTHCVVFQRLTTQVVRSAQCPRAPDWVYTPTGYDSVLQNFSAEANLSCLGYSEGALNDFSGYGTKVEGASSAKHVEPSKPSPRANRDVSEENLNTSKFLTMSSPEYIVYTDGELEQARTSYFEQKRLGSTTTDLSKELFCRLVRNTMTNMISIARALKDSRYPSKHEVDTMAKRLVEYYPMLKKPSSSANEWEHVAKKLMKRLSNVKSPRKNSSPSKKRRMTYEEYCATDFDGYSTPSSQASTIILEKSPAASTPEPHPNSSEEDPAAVAHLLNLEFESRRRFITSDVVREQDRPTKVLEAYPCFKELDHRIIEPKNPNYMAETRARWENFFSKVKFYAVMKKAMKPPKTLNSVDHTLAVFAAFPLLFPSGVPPPKKLGSYGEAFFHVLKAAEDPEGYLQHRPLSCPILLVSKDNCMIATGNTAVTTFESAKLEEGLVYLMAYYYTFHLTYPKCISTLLSVLQTEVLQDSIHERDATSSYKKAIAEWKSFTE
ncbi:hypothetical protein WMY93_008552 [Mugilogobius chulae]|uniref:Uncharacterized protein n=1 Tax=Mugilogobius chulae TaxID=88201 RepID=A0AAW0PST8_9GOBI